MLSVAEVALEDLFPCNHGIHFFKLCLQTAQSSLKICWILPSLAARKLLGHPCRHTRRAAVRMLMSTAQLYKRAHPLLPTAIWHEGCLAEARPMPCWQQAAAEVSNESDPLVNTILAKASASSSEGSFPSGPGLLEWGALCPAADELLLRTHRAVTKQLQGTASQCHNRALDSVSWAVLVHHRAVKAGKDL